MADKIPCFAKVNIPDLAKLFDSKYKEGMSEAEQRQIGTDIALDYHKKLFEELNTFKEKDLKIKLTKEQKTYVSPDKSEAIKKITDDYQKQIDEANTPIPEPIPAKEEVPVGEVPDQNIEGAGSGKPPGGTVQKEKVEGEDGDWTHINKKDITDAEELLNKYPFGGAETWKNSVEKGLYKLRKLAKTGESLYDAAKNQVSDWAAKVRQEMLDTGKSTFNPNDEQIAQMAYHRASTNQKIGNLEAELTSPIEAVRAAAEIVLGDLEAQRDMVDYVLHNTATTAGRSFNIRQMISKVDGENGLQVKRMDIIRKQKGEPLSEKQEEEIRDVHDEEMKNQKAKDEATQKRQEADFEARVKEEVDRRMKAKGNKPTGKPFARTKAGNAIRKLKTPKGSSKLDFTLGGWDLLVEGVAKLVDTGINVKEAVSRLIKDGTIGFKSDKDRDAAIDYIDNAGKHNAIEGIKELAETEKSTMLTKSAVGQNHINDLVNHYIDKGLRGKEVFTELNKDLKEIFPEITEQQVRDAFLKEGEFTLEKKEKLNKEKTEAKSELSNIAKRETDLQDLEDYRSLRKRGFKSDREKTEYENKLIADKAAKLKESSDRRKQIIEDNRNVESERNRQLQKVKELQNRKDKLEQGIIEKQKRAEAARDTPEIEQLKKEVKDLETAIRKAESDRNVQIRKDNNKVTAEVNRQMKRVNDLTERKDKLEQGIREKRQSAKKVDTPEIEGLKEQVKKADADLREAEATARKMDKDIQDKKDKLAELDANINRAKNGIEQIKTYRNKSDVKIDADIAAKRTELQRELNKKGLKLEKGSKAEQEQKQKVVDLHNSRAEGLLSDINDRLSGANTTDAEKTALGNAKKLLEKSKVNKDSALDIFDAVDKAEKNLELARKELAQFDKLADIKKKITQSQIQMGKDKLSTEQDILLQRHKDNLQKNVDENERKIVSGEFVENEPARLKTTDAEAMRLEIKDRETKNKLDKIGRTAQRAAMTKREKFIDTVQSLYVIGLVGRLSTLIKVGVSAVTKQPLNTITSQSFGRLGGVLFPKIKEALRGEGAEGWRKEKNRYLAHYGALGKEGMAKMVNRGKVAEQKANENYLNAKDKLEDIENQHGKDSKQYKDFANGEFKKSENAQKQALLDNVTNSMYEWIGGNAWEDAAELFLHSTARLEQLLGKGEREMWKDKTRKEKIMFVLSSSAATHGVLKNFSARAEFAAQFTARLENKVKQGIDISSPDEILKTINESYIGFERGKYQEDNALTSGFKAGLEGLQRWGEKHPDYKYAADLMAGILKFKNPIVRTPINIAREAIVEYTLGVPLAIAKYRGSIKDAKIDAKKFDLAGEEMRKHMKKFMDNLPPDKADFIYRAFRKGGFGLGVMALTAMGGIGFGGFFNRDERRRKLKDKLNVNEVTIGGEKLSKLEAKVFTHTSAFFPALLWSNYERVREENIEAGHGELGANLDAIMKDFSGMMEQIPIGKEMQNPLQGIQIPLVGPFLTEYAESMDVDDSGEKIKRVPKGNPLEKLWQNFEMKVPGLRQNVPLSQSQGNTITKEDAEKYPIFKEFSEKGVNFPEFDPKQIQTKEVNGKVTEHLSDYPKDQQEKYIDAKKKAFKEELKSLKNGDYEVYRDENGTVHIRSENTDVSEMEEVRFKDLTPEDIQYLIGTHLSGNATRKAKEEVELKMNKK